ncbi:MAG: hypothetical protein DMD44_05140 [Gemmatimonadetes bacterium]|nr:MAG: hypothetical protein DMD44_05140 [Gemmatimonadota bacterium]
MKVPDRALGSAGLIMLLHASFVTLSAASAPATLAAADSCYHYRPAPVSLTGLLVQRRMPGPPHYDSFARGDRPVMVDFLVLDAPICTIPDYKDSPNSDAFQGQDTIQVRRAESTWRDVSRLMGSRVVVTGTLSEWALGPDRTPVVLDPTGVQPLK